jgi:hypothetical protein
VGAKMAGAIGTTVHVQTAGRNWRNSVDNLKETQDSGGAKVLEV